MSGLKPEEIAVCCVGAGNVGRSWALRFAAAGCDTRVFEPSLGQTRIARDAIGAAALDFDPASIRFYDALEPALSGASYVQESTPESLEVKCEVFRNIDRAADPGAVIGSSTSEIAASSFTQNLVGRDRCLVVHPLNPPHLIPLVELCPTPWTSNERVDWTRRFFQSIGHRPVLVRKEVSGFIANRLQLALLAEAINLVANGTCSATEVDIAVKDGLARRWINFGPLETAQLNGSEGFSGYINSYRECHRAIVENLNISYDTWTEDVVTRIESELQRESSHASIFEAQRARDRALQEISEFLRKQSDRSLRDETK